MSNRMNDSVDTTDRALSSNKIVINPVFPKMKDELPRNNIKTQDVLPDTVMNINEVLPNYKIQTALPVLIKTSPQEEEDIAKCEPILMKSVSFMTESSFVLDKEFPELIKAIQDEDIPLVDFIMKDKSVNQTSVMIATIKRDKVDLLKFLLQDIEDVASISESGESLLHAAASNGAVLCCQHLLSKGLSPGDWDDKVENTPMHCTARSKSQNNKKIFDLFLNNGGDTNVGINRSSGSPLYAAVQVNNLEMVKHILSQKSQSTDLLTPFLETPLHLAAKYNFHECVEALLETMPSLIDLKYFESETAEFGTALHIAAKHRHLETCKILLKYNADLYITNNQGMTPLHMAASNPHEEIITIFLEQEKHFELINTPDKDGRTPLFVCTSANGPSSTDCMDILISKGANVDKALLTAAEKGDVHSVELLISKDADLSTKNTDGFSALYLINQNVPQCMKFFEQRLDSGINLNGSFKKHKDIGAKINVDFRKIVRNIGKSEQKSNEIFLEIAKSPHERLLKHPLIESFLHIKWNQYKYLHFFTSIFTHFIFSLVYTLYAIYTFRILCPATLNEAWNMTSIFNEVVNCTCMLKDKNETVSNCIENNSSALPPLVQWLWIILLSFTVIYFFKEFYKWTIDPWIRFKSVESYLDILIIISVPLIFPFMSYYDDEKPTVKMWSFYRGQFHAAAIGVLAVWTEMMLHIGRVPRFGKYVQMFRVVASSVINFGIAYISLIIGFGFSFMILFPNSPAFDIRNGPAAFVKVIVMMLGELDYGELYYNQNQHFNLTTKNRIDIEQSTEGQMFPVTAHIILIGFVILVSIILMNLLIGLAVSDIQKMTKEGKHYRIVQQVELLNDLHEVGLNLSKYLDYLLCGRKDVLVSLLPQKCKNVLSGILPCYNFSVVNSLNVHLFENNTLLNESLKKNLHDHCLERQSMTKKELKNSERTEILYLLRKQSRNKSLSRKRSGSSKRTPTFSTSRRNLT